MIVRIFFLFVALLSMPANAKTVAILNGQLPTGPDHGDAVTIIITDGRITSLATDRPVPEDAMVIDAEGRMITAPLFAAATQIGLIQLGGSSSEDDSAAGSSALGPEFDPSLSFDPNALAVQLARANGVGRAMVYPGGAPDLFAGMGFLIDLNADGAEVTRPRSALFAMGTSARDAAGGSRAAAWAQLRARLQDGGQDGAIAEVRNGKVPIVLQVEDTVDIDRAISLQREFGLNVVIMGGAEAWRRAEQLAQADIAVVLDPLDDLPFYYTMVGARDDNAAILAAAGVRIAFSVSAQGIYRSWTVASASRLGAGVAVRNGLPYGAALAAITENPAAIWGVEGEAGLQIGNAADLVIWDGDPLEPSTAPWMILSGGEMLSRENRQILLRDRYLKRD
ncbi:amidohydrolase family protein [Croceicoccus sediminis]|uniref:amidohydrolase family protein n=1 Tax=Croceicoccus sediminis TaxID=2571150 RepID=UPI0011837804|nr:amidohydrolase family protein [Croceicoccus sediminis]